MRPSAATALLVLLSVTLAAATNTGGCRVANPTDCFPRLDAVREAARAAIAQARRLRDQYGTPGVALAVVFNGTVVAAEGIGVRRADARAGLPVTADTVFPLASLSKPLSSTVLAKFHDDDGGKWDWDTPIVAMDPSFRLRGSFETGDVTPVDLLSHRSGLADHAGDILEDLGFSRADIYARIRHHQTVPGSFRARYAYTNFGYSEPSFAVAKFRKPGISFEDQAARDFFGPAGMPSTSFKYSDLRGRSNRAFGHLLDPKTKKYVVASPQRNPDPQSPAGGASSSVRDLARWMLLHLGNGMLDGSRLVSAVSLGYTRSGLMRYVNGPIDKNPIAPTPQYGMGWIASIMPQSGMVKNTHSGAFILGTGTHVSIVPALQLGIVVVTNAQPVGLAEIVGSTFIDNVVYGAPLNNYEALFPPQFAELLTPLFGQNLTGPAPNPWRGNLTAFVGTYGNNSLYGTAEIARSGAGLVMKLGPPAKRMTFPLRGWDGPTFVYSTVGENGNGMPARVAFELRGGRAVKVVVENLERGLDPHFEPVGEGTFTRS